MTKFFTGILLTILSTSFPFADSSAQKNDLYVYQNLSKFALTKQVDSLKKVLQCPSLYKNKETQKKYNEIWESRTDFILGAINRNNYIQSQEIIGYLNGILAELKKGNPTLINSNTLLLVDRSESVNAYAIGNNILAVNLGLMSFANSREEIALVMAHELSHNILNHAEEAMKQKAELLTSEEYKNSLDDVLSSKYGRLTRLKQVLQGYSFSRSKHSRYKEGEADSLAVLMLKNSKIGFDPAVFLRLDSSDNHYRTSLKQEPGKYFSSYNVQMDEKWFVKKSTGLSSRKYNFKTDDKLDDSLKTHPDCKERFEKNKPMASATFSATSIPEDIRERVNKMIVWNMYDNLNLTPALYRILLLKDQNNTDPWYDFMVQNIFGALSYSDKRLARFNSIGIVRKEYISKHYYSLQTMLEQIPAEQLKSNFKLMASIPFWNNASADAKGFKGFLNSIVTSDELDTKAAGRASKDFVSQHPNSLYAEVAVRF